MLLVACYPYWVELGKREEVSSTMFREPKQWKPCWTSQKRLNGLEVVRHEGSLTTQTAIRPGQALARPWPGSKFVQEVADCTWT